jgi:hypothetical protein
LIITTDSNLELQIYNLNEHVEQDNEEGIEIKFTILKIFYKREKT